MKPILFSLCLTILALPALLWAQPQPLQFQFEPAVFPASISGVSISQPWCGGIDMLTPTFCDLDNDGDLDLFCGDSRSWIDYFQNIGTATTPNFQFLTSFFDSLYCYRTMVWCESNIKFADFDGDGLKDALLGGLGFHYLLLYHNHGTSSQPLFYPPADTLRETNGNIITSDYRFTLADIDSDRKLDLFLGTGDGYLKYYHNVGTTITPAFQLASSNWFNIHTTENYADPCFGDLDGDGRFDPEGQPAPPGQPSGKFPAKHGSFHSTYSNHRFSVTSHTPQGSITRRQHTSRMA